MNQEYKPISNEEFVEYIDYLCKGLSNYINSNGIKIDYVCPILRSGAVPAVYIANRLNIVKFAPIQVKHIKHNDGTSSTDKIFSPFESLKIEKENPVFLLVEGSHASGNSAKICIGEINANHEKAVILYVCVTKRYSSPDFIGDVVYEDTALCYNSFENYSREKCKELNIQYEIPIFPWEILEMEIDHPDDLEENINF